MSANASHRSQENLDNGQRAAAQPAAVGPLQQAASPSGALSRNRLAQSAQSKLGDIANGSARATQFKALAQLARQSPQARQQRALAQEVDNSPRMAAQRKTTGALAGAAIRRQTADTAQAAQKPNRTGLPDRLKSGVESLSGMRMDHVKVHYNSPQPAQLNAHAYAQGSDIHVAPGQQKHVPHEAWHVVQQAQGRVAPTMQMKGGVAVNDNAALEREADTMGARALQTASRARTAPTGAPAVAASGSGSVQRSADGSPIQLALHTIDTIDPYDIKGLKTDIDINNEAEGLSATTTTAKNLKTHIKWGAISNKGWEGTSVECVRLGPDHPLGSPTSSSSDIHNRVVAMDAAFKGHWKQGHLLNAELGGSGKDRRNLVAISTSTNDAMSRTFENELRNRINENGEWMHFKVEVTHAELTNPNAKKAAKKKHFSIPFYWAKTIDVTWGAIDDDGNPTGDTSTISLNAPEPESRTSDSKAPKTTGDTTSKASGSTNPVAKTTIGDDDVVLDSEGGIELQIERKKFAREKKYNQEILIEFECPPTPLHMEETDEKIKKDFSWHEPLSNFEGNFFEYLNTNKRKRQSEKRQDYEKELLQEIKKVKKEERYEYPLKLAKLLLNNKTNEKLAEALKVADGEYTELGAEAAKIPNILPLFDFSPEQIARLLGENLYKKNATAYQNYFLKLKTALE